MRLLVVLWQGVDWPTARSATERGVMPRLRALLAQSRVQVLHQPASDGPPPWRAIDQAGRRVHQVGWPAATAADATGVVVSEDFAVEPRWASIHPPELVQELAPLALAWSDVDEASLEAIIPTAKGWTVDDVRRRAVAQFVAATASIHTAATWTMERRPWDVMAVRYAAFPALQRVLADADVMNKSQVHAQVHASAPSLSSLAETGVCHFYDMLLARLLELAGPETAVALLLDPPPVISKAESDSARHATTLIASQRFAESLHPAAGKLLQRDWPTTVLAFFGLDGSASPTLLPNQQSLHALSRTAENHFRAGRYQACCAVLEQMRQAGVNTPPLQFALAALDFIDGRRDEAAARLERAQTIGPCSARLLELIGRLYLRIRRPAEGLQALQAAVHQDPALATAFEARAIAYLLLRDPAAAEREARAAVQLEPQRFESHYRLGLALRRQDRLAEARDAFRAAIAVEPDASGPAHRRLAEVCEQLGQPAFAAHHRALAERQPRSARPTPFDIEWFAQGLAS